MDRDDSATTLSSLVLEILRQVLMAFDDMEPPPDNWERLNELGHELDRRMDGAKR